MANQQKITIYTMTHCPYCVRAKKLFESKGWKFEEILLAEDDDAAWDALEAKTKYKTVPQIFIGEKFYGGYSDIAALDSKGDLDRIVQG